MANDIELNDPLKQWLAYAPPVPALAEGKNWHVFLSYRSVHRDWAIKLYDALTQAGFVVFLDQFKLVPGASLVTSLSQALSQSVSGVILWSNESSDSAWCQTEYETMHNMKVSPGSGFHFVVIKTGDQDLPLFARNALYEDFSQSQEGPHGAGLLRVMYGLLNQPLSEEAVRFAQKVDEATRGELISIKAARDIGDAARLSKLAASATLPWLTSPLLACQTADALIALEDADAALDVLARAQALFPSSIRPKQLMSLALARSGQWSESQVLLAELYAAGHRDPETVGLFARTWMDRYNSSGNRQHLEKSRNLYAEVFALCPHSYYTGINAAAKSVLLGELDTAAQYAAEVEKIVGDTPDTADYWKTATMAEVQLMQKKVDKAAKLYRAAVCAAPEEKGSHRSTLCQARLLMKQLQLTPEECQTIEDAFQ